MFYHPPPSDPQPSPKKLAKEQSVVGFFAGGAVLVALGYCSYSDLKGNQGVLFGLSRQLAASVPLIASGALNLLSGFLILLTSKRIWPISGAVASTLFAVFVIAFCVAARDREFYYQAHPLPAAVVAFGVWAQTRRFLKSSVPK
jgi:hypothetical protein